MPPQPLALPCVRHAATPRTDCPQGSRRTNATPPHPHPTHFCCAVQELATQVGRDLLPALRAKGVKLYFVSIGTAERGVLFCEQTGAWFMGGWVGHEVLQTDGCNNGWVGG